MERAGWLWPSVLRSSTFGAPSDFQPLVRDDAQFSVVEQLHDGSKLVQLSKEPLTQRSPEQHELVTEQCWPAPGQLPA